MLLANGSRASFALGKPGRTSDDHDILLKLPTPPPPFHRFGPVPLGPLMLESSPHETRTRSALQSVASILPPHRPQLRLVSPPRVSPESLASLASPSVVSPSRAHEPRMAHPAANSALDQDLSMTELVCSFDEPLFLLAPFPLSLVLLFLFDCAFTLPFNQSPLSEDMFGIPGIPQHNFSRSLL